MENDVEAGSGHFRLRSGDLVHNWPYAMERRLGTSSWSILRFTENGEVAFLYLFHSFLKRIYTSNISISSTQSSDVTRIDKPFSHSEKWLTETLYISGKFQTRSIHQGNSVPNVCTESPRRIRCLVRNSFK